MEVISLVSETLYLLPPASELPKSPVEGFEPFLTQDQLCLWLGYSRSTVQRLRLREEHPLPAVGTLGGPRYLPSQVLQWMEEEYARASAAQ